jgi:protein gp37
VAGSDKPVWVFCASLADVFDNEADPKDRADLFELIRECSNLQFQLVTKRVQNVAKMLPPDFSKTVRNFGVIATVVNQAECDRDLPKLIYTKQALDIPWVGLSIEPQLGPVVPYHADFLDWVITGGESNQRQGKGRPYDPAWARFLIYDGRLSGYRVFVKQMGSNPIGIKLKEGSGSDPNEWPEDLRVREWPEVRI